MRGLHTEVVEGPEAGGFLVESWGRRVQTVEPTGGAAAREQQEVERGASLLISAAGEVIHASPEARAMLGAREPDLVGQSLVRLTTWADRAKVIAWLGESPRCKELVFQVERRRGMVGTITGIASCGAVVEGEPTWVWLESADGDAATDDRRELQRLHAEIEDLARINDGLSKLACTVAHDVRSPMMAISVAAEALAQEAGPDLNERSQWLLGRVLHGVGRMSNTIGAALRCSRAGADLRIGLVDCDELVASVVQGLSPALENAGAHVHVSALGSVIADGEQLALVISNLIENSIRYCSPSRALSITITSEDGPAQRTIAVADNGLGIPAEDRDRVFRMFERLDHSAGGNGIGLAICHRVVSAHGGRIWASGNDQGGVTIRFTVPRQALTT